MGMMENSATIVSPLVLRNMLTSVLIFADKSVLNLAEKYKLLQLIRYLISTSFLFFLRLFPSLFPSNLHSQMQADHYTFKPSQNDSYVAASGVGESGIARALSQLLSSVNDIPVSSRKYDIVRSLAETLVEDNNREDIIALRELNRTVLSAAFSRTLCQLEAAMANQLGRDRVGLDGAGPVQYRLNRVLQVVRSVGDGVWTRVGRGRDDGNRSGKSAEKPAAEMFWLAQKMADCGFEEEALERWASASNLAWLSLLAEPRLQGSLLKVSAFLFKQTKNMGLEVERIEEGNKESFRQTKMKMLTSWLPLLCRASIGTDVPVLSISERAELEKVLEETIEMLEQEEQEQVLSLWLHHFTYCPSSDWPNLHASYARWCTTSRKLFSSTLKI
ncbi:hypothetical protein PTKIN_Ptkin02bG0151900 [Pterospermum kingtungense]